MVEIIRKTILTLAAVALLLVANTTTAAAQQPSLAERQLKQLALRQANIAAQIEAVESEYAQTPTDSLGKVLYALRHSAEAIEKTIAQLQAAAPQAPELKEDEEAVAADKPKAEVEDTADNTPTINTIDTAKVNQVGKLFSGAMRRYALTEGEIEALCKEYAELHAQAVECAKGYEEATNMADNNKHYNTLQEIGSKATKLLDQIADRSDQMFESMTTAYASFADSLGMVDEKALFVRNRMQMEEAMTKQLAGTVADMDLAMYPYRKAVMTNMEVKLARKLLTDEEVAELLAKMEAIVPDSYTLAPMATIKRAEAKFADVVMQKSSKYSSVAKVPRIKIPARGEVYSILLGNYANPPAISAFRGATPLSTERREDGKTYIYAGLFPTDKCATETIDRLRKAGFKQPQLVMWYNGIRRDDYVDRISTPKTTFYTVEIRGVTEVLDTQVVEAIRQNAPKKEISKFTEPSGSVVYTIGTFTAKKEADKVQKAVLKANNQLQATITSITK